MFVMAAASCGQREEPFRAYAWMSGKVSMTDEVLDDYFSRAADAGLSGIFLECHGGYPEVLGDSTAFRDSAALVILRHLPALLRILRGQEPRFSFRRDLTYKLDERY